jgi:hypothetical protein
MHNGGHQVGIPIGVDVPVGVQKVPGQGSFDRTVECTLLAGPLAGETIHIMPTGRPTPA